MSKRKKCDILIWGTKHFRFGMLCDAISAPSPFQDTPCSMSLANCSDPWLWLVRNHRFADVDCPSDQARWTNWTRLLLVRCCCDDQQQDVGIADKNKPQWWVAGEDQQETGNLTRNLVDQRMPFVVNLMKLFPNRRLLRNYDSISVRHVQRGRWGKWKEIPLLFLGVVGGANFYTKNLKEFPINLHIAKYCAVVPFIRIVVSKFGSERRTFFWSP